MSFGDRQGSIIAEFLVLDCVDHLPDTEAEDVYEMTSRLTLGEANINTQPLNYLYLLVELLHVHKSLSLWLS